MRFLGHTLGIRRTLLAGPWLTLLAACASAAAPGDLSQSSHVPAAAAARSAAAPAETSWVIAAEDAPWSLALAAPVAARLQQSGAAPLLMAVTSPPTREAEWLLSLTPARRPIVLATSDDLKLGLVLGRRSPSVLKIGNDPCTASALVARHFWTRSRAAVIAAADDPEAAILGSALASALRVPLLLCRHDQPDGSEAALRQLGVTKMLLAVSEGKTAPPRLGQLDIPAEVLPPRLLQRRLIAALGRDKIRNVVVARAPDDRADLGRSAWLAPYVSLARSAVVVLVHAQAAAVAEADVQQLIQRESLPIRTVTVLADYTSIGYRNVEVDPNGSEDFQPMTPIAPQQAGNGEPGAARKSAAIAAAAARPAVLPRMAAGSAMPPLAVAPSSGTCESAPAARAAAIPPAISAAGTTAASAAATAVLQPSATGGTLDVPAPPPHYSVRTEPFIPTLPDQISAFGVGRLPLESLGDSSVMFARGLLRERLLADQTPRVLMVANSGTQRKLVLCETISRITAAEFKNAGVHVDEFYGRLADAPEILSAARTANLILYEGHLANQDLIDAPVLHRSPAGDYPEDENDDLEAGEAKRPDSEGVDGAPSPILSATGLRSMPGKGTLFDPPPRVVPAEPIARHLQGPLDGLPIVFLQSCESLDDSVLWRLDELGGVALIGSMTSIHSAAGSSMLNVAMSSLLYRGGSVGEVLRDAQNYMLCVEDLKGRRGHKEQAKGVRVALSFRLWGDPELRVLPMPLPPPRQAPLRAEWVGLNTLRIDVPQERLPEARCDVYSAWSFPNSQFAGLLRPEGDLAKRLSPIYFFCLPLPSNLSSAGARVLEPARADAKHVEVRVDRGLGVVYVVYLPDQEAPGDSVVLRLRETRPSEQLGRAP